MRERTELESALADVIYDEQRRRKWSNIDLAAGTGMHATHVARALSGGYRRHAGICSLRMAERFAKAFGLSVSELVMRAEAVIRQRRVRSA